MKPAQRFLFTTVLLSVLGLQAQAQLAKYTKEADELYRTGMYVAAADKYIQAEPKLKDVNDKGLVLYRAGECYRMGLQPQNALQWYEKSITAQYYKVDEEVYYGYGLALQNLGKLDEAIVQFNRYIEKGGDKAKAQAQITSCETAKAQLDKPKTKLLVEPVTELNSQFSDFAPMWGTKGYDQIIFTSNRQSSTGSKTDPIKNQRFTDLFFSDIDKKKKMSTPAPLGGAINTPNHEGAGTFDGDFKNIYFTKCDCPNDKGRFGCDIYMARRQGGSFVDTLNLRLIDRGERDDSTRIGHPTLSADDKTMVFAMNTPGAPQGRDLYMTTWDKKTDKWTKAKRIDNLNTNHDEMYPYIHPKTGALYFASNRPGGLGGLDIYKAEKTGDNTWGNPVNLEAPINSGSDDFAIIFDKDSENSGYFSSNRPGSQGDDIYRFHEPPIEICFKGFVYDKLTGAALANATVTASIAPEGKTIPLTTDGNGGFSLCNKELKPNDVLSLKMEKEKYISTSDKVSIGTPKESITITKEYFLDPVIEKKEYKMPLVLYPYNEDKLLVDGTVNSQDSLNFLLTLMQENPTFIIQLEAHTDFRGEDKYNLDLSQRRAATCVNYLISKGIDPARLKPVGRGEKEPYTIKAGEATPFPVGTTLTEAYIKKLSPEQQEIAHQINRRTIFRIIGTDYKPKN